MRKPGPCGSGFCKFSAVWPLSASSGDGADAGAHQADAVEVGLLAGVFLGAFAGLVALVEELDLLQLLEGSAKAALASSSWPLSSSAERVRFSRRWIAALA